VNSVAFSPDGKTLASGSDDSTIKMWDVASASERLTISNTVNSISNGAEIGVASVTSVAFSPDGKTLVSGSNLWGGEPYNNTITLWDVASGQKLSTLSGYTGAVFRVAFSPDGKFITSDSGDGTIRLWGVYP
jgi:WD40 repeat protein